MTLKPWTFFARDSRERRPRFSLGCKTDIRLADVCLLAALCAVASPLKAQDFAAEVLPQPAYRADDFIDMVGINGMPIQIQEKDAYDPQLFYDLGIRHYRMVLHFALTKPDQPAQVEAAWVKSGARPLMLIDPHRTTNGAQVVEKLKLYAPGSVEAVEGPNEVNNKFPPQELNLRFGGRTDEAAGAAFMNDVYRAIKSDPATRKLEVIAFDAIFTDYSLARPHAAFDFADMHSYQGYNVPSASILPNMINFNHILPRGGVIKPFMPTECGYNVEEDISNGTKKTGSERAQALNIPMLLAEYFRHGVKRAYLFALPNVDGYGLLESDKKTKRPSYTALKSLLDELRDATWNSTLKRWQGNDFTPKPLLFTLEGAPPTVHCLTLQKKSGQYDLLIWNEVRNFDQDTARALDPAPVSVSLKFSTPLQGPAIVLTQNAQGGRDASTVAMQGQELPLEVPSSVMIVRLQPQSHGSGAPLAKVTNLSGQATESSVRLSWHNPASGSPAGFFVWRNGAHIATTTTNSYDDNSEWLRPGLGYTYGVQAFGPDGKVSTPVTKVVTTPDKEPDLVVADLQMVPPQPKAGDSVRFQAVVKNSGDGNMPKGTGVSMAFFIDGKEVSWSGEAISLAPGGEAHTFAANGGPQGPAWTATAGAHNLMVKVDDQDHLPDERSKENNVMERSFLVDVPATGLLAGLTEAASGILDLSAEGSLDWICWGIGGNDGLDRKQTGLAAWGPLTEVGTGYRNATVGCAVGETFTDGAPMPSATRTHEGLWWNGVGHGYSFTAPADATERVLRVYVQGINGARGRLTAHLSDNSAPDYVSEAWDANHGIGHWSAVPGSFSAVYTLHYRSATPKQSLVVSWILADEPNRFLGQARLQAATLSEASPGTATAVK